MALVLFGVTYISDKPYRMECPGGPLVALQHCPTPTLLIFIELRGVQTLLNHSLGNSRQHV
jgi:hypothetical protein